MVGLRGLEPLTSSLSGKRSNRLSYRPGSHPSASPGQAVGGADGKITASGSAAQTEAGRTARTGSAVVLGEGDLDAAEQRGGQVVEERAQRRDRGDQQDVETPTIMVKPMHPTDPDVVLDVEVLAWSPPSTSSTVLLIESQTPAAPSTDQTTNTDDHEHDAERDRQQERRLHHRPRVEVHQPQPGPTGAARAGFDAHVVRRGGLSCSGYRRGPAPVAPPSDRFAVRDEDGRTRAADDDRGAGCGDRRGHPLGERGLPGVVVASASAGRTAVVGGPAACRRHVVGRPSVLVVGVGLSGCLGVCCVVCWVVGSVDCRTRATSFTSASGRRLVTVPVVRPVRRRSRVVPPRGLDRTVEDLWSTRARRCARPRPRRRPRWRRRTARPWCRGRSVGRSSSTRAAGHLAGLLDGQHLVALDDDERADQAAPVVVLLHRLDADAAACLQPVLRDPGALGEAAVGDGEDVLLDDRELGSADPSASSAATCSARITDIDSSSSPARNFIPVTPDVARPIGRSWLSSARNRIDWPLRETSSRSSSAVRQLGADQLVVVLAEVDRDDAGLAGRVVVGRAGSSSPGRCGSPARGRAPARSRGSPAPARSARRAGRTAGRPRDRPWRRARPRAGCRPWCGRPGRRW